MDKEETLLQRVAQLEEDLKSSHKHHQNKWLTTVLFIFIALLLAGIAFLLTRSSTVPPTKLTDTPTSEIDTTSAILNTEKWKTYTDIEAGFSFKYPPTLVLNEQNESQLALGISAEKLSTIPEQLPQLMGRDDAIKQKERLAKTGGDIKIGSVSGETSVTFSQFEVCSVLFSQRLTFYPGDYRVILTLSAPEKLVISQMGEFFKKDPANCGDKLVWNRDKMSEFTSALEKGQGTGVAQQWHDIFNAMIKTVTLIPPSTPSAATPTQKVSNGSLKYENMKYGFEIFYDAPYRALDDKENLYGYPHGIALIYAGGQAYDVVIEVWDSQSEYQAEYASRLSDITVFQSNDKFITLLNNTKRPENEKIIASFKLLSQ